MEDEWAREEATWIIKAIACGCSKTRVVRETLVVARVHMGGLCVVRPQ